MHCLPGQPPRFGARPMPLTCKSKGETATGQYVWRRKVGLSAIYDPVPTDVTQTSIPRESIDAAKRNPAPDFGWVGERPQRWEPDLIEDRGLDTITKCNGRVRIARPVKGDELPRRGSIPALPKDDAEDKAKLPWVRKTGTGVQWNAVESEVGLPPARMKADAAGYLVPSKNRRQPIAQCPIPGHDGLRRPQSRIGRPITQKFLDDKIKTESHLESALRTSEDLQSLLHVADEQDRAASCPPFSETLNRMAEETQMSVPTAGGMPSRQPGMATQVEQQQLLSPAGELLNIYGLPRCEEPSMSPERFKQLHSEEQAARLDGSTSSAVCHHIRKHLGGIPRGHGTVSAAYESSPKQEVNVVQSQTSEADSQGHDITTNPENSGEHITGPTPNDVGSLDEMSKLKWMASVSPFPQGYASKGTFKLVSSTPYGASLLGSRSDQGGSRLGCFQTAGRFTGPDRGARILDGLPPRYEGAPPHLKGMHGGVKAPIASLQSPPKRGIRLNRNQPEMAAWKTPINTFDTWL